MWSSDVFDGAPSEESLLLTVDEAARLMRIGRTKAYAMAREYLNSGGIGGPSGDLLRSPAACASRAGRWSS